MSIRDYLRNIRKMILHPEKYELKSKRPEKKVPVIKEVQPAFEWLSFPAAAISRKDGKLPISVVVPTIKTRTRFFNDFVYPMLEINNPAEIIVIDDEDICVQEKRNKGASQSTQDYLFFCDDDIILPNGYLRTLFEVMEKNPEIGYAYTDYQAIVMHPDIHPSKKNYYHRAREFNEELLKADNYISTMSLIRKKFFPGFDASIKRLQDWDVWLTLLKKGINGKYVKGMGFIAYYLDDGITASKNNIFEARAALGHKHNLINLINGKSK